MAMVIPSTERVAMGTSERTAPDTAFLGFCDRTQEVRDGHPAFWGFNLMRVSENRVFSIFPCNLRGTGIVMGLYDPKPNEEIKLLFRERESKATFNLSMQMLLSSGETQEAMHDNNRLNIGWKLIATPLGADIIVSAPGYYDVYREIEDSQIYLSSVTFFHTETPPFTTEDVLAIKSDPLASKFIRMTVKCTECGDTFNAYVGIEKSPNSEEKGFLWSPDLPDRRFACSCNKINFDLKYIRTGLHGLLRRNTDPAISTNISADRLYERTALEQICRDYQKLIDGDSKEEILQNFLEANPIFFHVFLPNKLFFKPKILTKYIADFAILNERNELVLIEIERPQIKLSKKDGGHTAELEHAFFQVRSWIQEVNDHRAAVLSPLNLELRQVAKVKGIVIGGRNPNNEDHLKLLRASSHHDIEFFTYDDLLKAVSELVKHLATI
jgi:Domain of unknown function (DUF4263)